MLTKSRYDTPSEPTSASTGARSRILVVDDSEDDAELVRRALRRGGLQCVITRVDDAPSFRNALSTQAWDLVIADYSQPSFGALALLQLLRELNSDMPCVVISGVAGEDRAVETMRAGAKDFVSKDRLQRLTPVIQRELAESALRRDRERVRQEEAERDLRMHEAGATLFELLRSGDFTTGNSTAVYRALTELVARTLDVDRVSVWMFDRGRTTFRCVQSFNRRDGEHTSGRSYQIDENPDYFRALELSRYVEAHSGCGDPRMPDACSAAIDDMSSQLDAAIRFRGEMVGALCLDHLGSDRRWRTHEQVFVGSIADLISLVIETNERRRTELALRESEVRYRELWQNALDGMFTVDRDGLLTSVNDAGSRLAQLPPADVVGRHFTEFISPREVKAARAGFEALVSNAIVGADPFSFTLVRHNNRRVQVEATAQRIERGGRLVEILAIVRDVSQRRHLEAQLQQSQKMEAIGRLAGGVAHDFNNLLTAIIGYSQIAAIRPDMPAAAVIDLKEITSAAHRAAALTRQLLAFSRRQVLEPRVLNINGVVSGIELMLQRLIGEEVELVTDLDVTIAHVLADPSQLEQVILNLTVNARDALPQGGRIAIRTRMASELDRRALISTDASPGPFVVLEVTDDGLGMDEDTRSHIFEPFFTTKALGTGLGLSTVYGIVQQSGGGIAVTSETGKGSTFSVFLPIALGNTDEYSMPSAVIGPTGSETVLVVEDDDRVRALACRVLRLAGYTVIEASDPQSAISIAETTGSIDLVLTDLVMPVMRGRELVERLSTIRPHARTLYMSGYREEAEVQELSGAAFLPKPFTPEALTTAVRGVLDLRSPND
ncbi:MAG: response regulator [Gemmatimonadaceae bacterium]